MAKINNTDHALKHGKLNKKDDVIYRTRNGKQFIYTTSESEVPASEAQNAHRKLFGKVTAIVNAIEADPKQKAEWDQKRLAYNQNLSANHEWNAKRYDTVRSFAHFVITQQLEQAEAKKRKKRPMPKALPKGLKLHIKHFADLSTTELYEILKARFAVFYHEQHIVYPDMDDLDYNAIHLALHRKGRVIAYARFFQGKEQGKEQWIIGRMLTLERGKGYGRYIMEQTLAEAVQREAKSLVVHAQTQAVSFYEKFGFKTFGNIFMEADIPHVCMKKDL